MIKNIQSKAYGRFKIDFNLINTRPEKVREVLGQMIVVQAEPMYEMGGVVYVAICDLFKPVEADVRIPDYNLSFENGKLVAKPMQPIKV